MQNRFKLLLLLPVIGIILCQSLWSENRRVYSITPTLNIRKLPSVQAKVITKLRHNRWVEVIEKNASGDWLKIKLANGKTGYAAARLVTDLWIKILKDERELMLMKDRKVLKKYAHGLGFNPANDKVKLGDGCTPEGRFYICEILIKPKPANSYGPVSLRISYPNIEDARRGLKAKIINKAQYKAIVRAIDKGRMPPQNTKLGGSIKLHGGKWGASGDWTLGCVAIANSHITELHKSVPGIRTMVEVFRNRQQERQYNTGGAVNRQVLYASKRLLKKGCKYTGKATRIIPLSYPMGDFDSSQGVCTDVVIRSLRGLNIDLQALLYEDILLYPGRYRNIARANPNIDHRRTRNLKKYFDHNALVLTTEPPLKSPTQWKPGDIVLMDTGISNGTIYDHIGIVSDNKDIDGSPLVINLWTVGWKLNEMQLLNGDYPKIVGHYRLLNRLFYDAY
jgi:uncharacterized protein YijF (DUF1287 family)